jgi:hypothetical protein
MPNALKLTGHGLGQRKPVITYPGKYSLGKGIAVTDIEL